MTDCIVLDFDGTITTRDTTRYLLHELLKLRPWRIFAVLPHLVRMLSVREGSKIQQAKNQAISALLKGLTPESLAPAITGYSASVGCLLRPKLLELMRQRAASGELVLVVTASPDFAIHGALSAEAVKTVGTTFPVQDGRFSGATVGVGCYGQNKPEFIKAWAKAHGPPTIFVEAWSDAESDLPMMLLATRRYWIPLNKNVERIRELDPCGRIVQC